jgi:hypothetical protein
MELKVLNVNTIRYMEKQIPIYQKGIISEGRSGLQKGHCESLKAGDTIDFYANV